MDCFNDEGASHTAKSSLQNWPLHFSRISDSSRILFYFNLKSLKIIQ